LSIFLPSDSVLPAHAGMIPRRRQPRPRPPSAPRARGDDPQAEDQRSLAVPCSPRTRGWSTAP